MKRGHHGSAPKAGLRLLINLGPYRALDEPVSSREHGADIAAAALHTMHLRVDDYDAFEHLVTDGVYRDGFGLTIRVAQGEAA